MANQTILTFEVTAQKKTFKSDKTGENIEYIGLTMIVDGQSINVKVAPKSQELFNFLVSKYFD